MYACFNDITHIWYEDGHKMGDVNFVFSRQRHVHDAEVHKGPKAYL